MSEFYHEFIRGRILRHPIHSMLVHFPAALIPTSVVFDIIAWFLKDKLFSSVAFYTLGIGLLGGVVAAIFGSIDYARLSPDHIAWKKASLHAFLNVTWLIVFGTIFGLKMTAYPSIEIATPLELSISFICVLGLIFSNYLGGELVYHHKVGTFNSEE